MSLGLFVLAAAQLLQVYTNMYARCLRASAVQSTRIARLVTASYARMGEGLLCTRTRCKVCGCIVMSLRPPIPPFLRLV